MVTKALLPEGKVSSWVSHLELPTRGRVSSWDTHLKRYPTTSYQLLSATHISVQQVRQDATWPGQRAGQHPGDKKPQVALQTTNERERRD